ncbi:MAG TPA: hypothetical protein VGH81_10805 [Rudaea sp.]
MKKLRDWLVLLAVAAAFAISLALLRRVVGLTSPWFALMTMFDVLGLVAFARPLFLLKLPGFLQREREWETKGRLYKALGVPAFGVLLRRTPLRYLNPLVYLKRCPDPSIVQGQIESAEAAHLLAATLLVPYMTYAGVHGWWSAVAWLMVAQIGVNLYPVLHLRWVRVRINRLHHRIFSNSQT